MMTMTTNKDNVANTKSLPSAAVSHTKVGVSLTSSGKYGARITNPLTKKRVRLGVFDTEEDAANAYMAKKAKFMAKKEEMEKEKVYEEDVEAPMRVRNNLGVSQTKFVGVSKVSSGIYGARIRIPSTKKQLRVGVFDTEEEAVNAYLAKKAEFMAKKAELEKEKVDNLGVSRTEIVGVSKKRGKYVARITHPLTKKRLWLGTFKTNREAFEVYLTKKTELENEVEGNQGHPCVECKDGGIENTVDNQWGPISNESNNNPCSEKQDQSSMEGDLSGSPDQAKNQDSSMEGDVSGSSDKETASNESNNNPSLENSEGSQEPEFIVVPSVQSSMRSDVEILLRTKSGEAVKTLMDFYWVIGAG